MDLGSTPPASNSATWYAVGYNPSAPATGLPSGAAFQSATDSGILYQLPSFASGNDAVLLEGFGSGAVPSALLTFASPTAYASLSLLTATSNGPGVVDVTVNLANGVSYQAGSFSSPDWFASQPAAFVANGRVEPSGLNSVNSGNPRLFDGIISLEPSDVPVNSITIAFAGRLPISSTVVFAVSGVSRQSGGLYEPVQLTSSSFNQSLVATAAVPEPTAGIVGLLLLSSACVVNDAPDADSRSRLI